MRAYIHTHISFKEVANYFTHCEFFTLGVNGSFLCSRGSFSLLRDRMMRDGVGPAKVRKYIYIGYIDTGQDE